MRISDWSSDVCSSDLMLFRPAFADVRTGGFLAHRMKIEFAHQLARFGIAGTGRCLDANPVGLAGALKRLGRLRSEEHTSELQSLMRISYAVFCLKKKTKTTHNRLMLNNVKCIRRREHKRYRKI